MNWKTPAPKETGVFFQHKVGVLLKPLQKDYNKQDQFVQIN